MVQITTIRFSPFFPASYISGGKLWGQKKPETPINSELREIMGMHLTGRHLICRDKQQSFGEGCRIHEIVAKRFRLGSGVPRSESNGFRGILPKNAISIFIR